MQDKAMDVKKNSHELHNFFFLVVGCQTNGGDIKRTLQTCWVLGNVVVCESLE